MKNYFSLLLILLFVFTQGCKTYESSFTGTAWQQHGSPEERLIIAHKTKLKLFTILGISYKGTVDKVYWKMIDLLVNSKTKPKDNFTSSYIKNSIKSYQTIFSTYCNNWRDLSSNWYQSTKESS